MNPNWQLVGWIIDTQVADLGGWEEYERTRDPKAPGKRTVQRYRADGVDLRKQGARDVERAVGLPGHTLRLALDRKYDVLLEMPLPADVRTLVLEARHDDNPPTRNSKAV